MYKEHSLLSPRVDEIATHLMDKSCSFKTFSVFKRNDEGNADIFIRSSCADANSFSTIYWPHGGHCLRLHYNDYTAAFGDDLLALQWLMPQINSCTTVAFSS